MDWSSYFMGPGRFGMGAMPAGGYQLGAYDPRAAAMAAAQAAQAARAAQAPHDMPPGISMASPPAMDPRPLLFGQRFGPSADRRMVDRGVNTGRGFFADLRALRDKLNPFGNGGGGGGGGGAVANGPAGGGARGGQQMGGGRRAF